MANNVLPDPLNTNPVPKDFYFEVSRGNIPGHEIVTIAGRNTDVDTGSAESISDVGGVVTVSLVGEQYSLVSDDAADDLVGVGAQQVRLVYLDTDYIQQTEIIEMDGLTPVLTVATNIFRFLQLNTIAVGATGTAGTNQGNITVSGSITRGIMKQFANRSLHGLYTIPAGKTGHVIYGYATIAKNKDSRISIEFSIGDSGVLFSGLPIELYQNSFTLDPKGPIIELPEKSEINPICDTENNNTRVSIVYQVLLVDD